MTSDPRIDRLEGIVEELRNEIHSLHSEMNSRFSEVNSRFSSLESRMTTMWASTMGTIIAGVIALVVAILLQS